MVQSIYSKKNLNRKYKLSKSINLTKDPIWSLLKNVTIPASVGSLFQTFYNLVDTWFAGRISAEAISAIAKSFPIYFTIIAVGVGIGAATNACIGNLIGRKEINRASLFIAQSVVFAIVYFNYCDFVWSKCFNFSSRCYGIRCFKYSSNKRIFRYYFLWNFYCYDSNFFKWSFECTR